MSVFIGTSGWMYDHWKGIFYPENLPKNKWFNYYANYFDTVELNVTFYRLPPERNFISWEKKAPENFVYSIKGWGLITHRKKFKKVEENLKLFLTRVSRLKSKIGVIFFQTPPSLQKNTERLEEFLKLLYKFPNYRFAFEFRHSSWFTDDVKDILKKFKIGFVQIDHPELPCPRWITSDFVYIRMHGKDFLYAGNYDDEDLKGLANYIRGISPEVRHIYVYFNNDAEAYAVFNAIKLRKLIHEV